MPSTLQTNGKKKKCVIIWSQQPSTGTRWLQHNSYRKLSTSWQTSMEPGEALHQGKEFLGCSKMFLCSDALVVWHMVRGKHFFFKQSNWERVKLMSQCLVWVNVRELVLLEQWKKGWVSCDFQLCYKSVTQFILNVPALLFIWKIIFKIKCFLLSALCDSRLKHHSVICFLSCQTLNKQTSFWVTGKWWDLYQ